VTTPGWNAGITCGQCHGNGSGTANSEPAPTMTASVAGSHAIHIDTQVADFTDCQGCHTMVSYTASGGTNHQNLTVDVTGMTGATYSDTANTAGGVNWSSLGTTHVDDGTCTFTGGCHDGLTPVWGGTLANACESCHDSTPYVKGSATAPNVMGYGTFAGDSGHLTPKPYDDGNYGFNVNGHGRDADTVDKSGTGSSPINIACTACHDTKQPAGTHFDGVLNGRISPDTRNSNSFHLVSGYFGVEGTEKALQINFDNYCAVTCHGTHQMRHTNDTVDLNAVEFGTHGTFSAPRNFTLPLMYYDRNLKTGFDAAPDYALCVSCHDPHGTSLTSPRGDGNNKMVILQWMDPPALCARCHS